MSLALTSGVTILIIVFAAVGIIIQVLFLANLRDLLREVSDQNRTMRPNYVWLNFIPIFGIAWIFVTITRIRDSVQAEFRSRGWPAAGDFGFGVGITYAIANVVSGVVTPVRWYDQGAGGYTVLLSLGGLLGLVGLVCWIMYWVRTSELKRRLRVGAPSQGMAGGPPASGSWGGSLGQGPGQASDQARGQGYGQSPGVQQAETRCPQCGLLALPDDDYCRSCGQDLQTSTATEGTCPFCGAAYPSYARFCPTCGRPVG